jgi:hypothetical protein
MPIPEHTFSMNIRLQEGKLRTRRTSLVGFVLIGVLFTSWLVWMRRQPGNGSTLIVGKALQGRAELSRPLMPDAAAAGRNAYTARSNPGFSSQKRLQHQWARPTILERVLPQTDTRARYLFESALMDIRKGRFAEARETLQELLQAFPDEKTSPLARWSMGNVYYREGGRENLHKAADIFAELVLGDEYDPDLEELYQAALIDVALIELDLARSAPSELPPGETAGLTAEIASLAMVVFLEKWPGSPQAGAAQSILQELLTLGPH